MAPVLRFKHLGLAVRQPAPCKPHSCTRTAFRPAAVAAPPKPKTPSRSTGASELDSLSQWSQLVPDSLQLEAPRSPLAAATVSCALLQGVMASQRLGLKPYENAVQSALAYDRCSGLRGSARLECVLDKALANVGALLAAQVEGRVATELDPRLADDTGALVSKAQGLVALYEEMGVKRSKLIFRIPATWAGIQAARQLEGKGIATQVFLVYSLVQGVAAMQGGASVLQPNVGRVRDWFTKHPGVIRDPKGPREDSGFGSSSDPGVELVRSLYSYSRKYHPNTRVMASGIRSREDALALSGCDYLVLGPRVMSELAAQTTDQGYNDGLSAVAGSSGLTPRLTPALASQAAVEQMSPVDEAAFQSGLGLVGAELLAAGLAGLQADVVSLMAQLKGMVTSTD